MNDRDIIDNVGDDTDSLRSGCEALERQIERVDCELAILRCCRENNIDAFEISNRLLNHTYQCEFTDQFIARVNGEFMSLREAIAMFE